jgi:hypothetical protein
MQIPVRLANIAGLLGWVVLGVDGRVGGGVGAMVGDALQPGLLESGLACLADRWAAAGVLVVGCDVADAGVQPHAVVALLDDGELGAEDRRVADLGQVGPLGLDVAEQRPRSRPDRSGCRVGRSAGGSRTRP